jgi:hypothetical protein
VSEVVVRVDPLNLDLGRLAMADMVVIDHPGTLSDEQIGWIAGLMRRGRGVLYIAAEPADAVNLKRLATLCGADLKMPVEFAPPQVSGATGGQRQFWTDFSKDVPPFSAFGQSMRAAAAELYFSGRLASRRLDNGLDSDVLVTYSDRSAALVQTACGPGMLAVLNAELTGSNLPGSPVFAPLISEAAERLIQRRSVMEVECGTPVSLLLPQEQTQAIGLKLAGPADADDTGQVIQDGQQVAWRAARVSAPGVYRVTKGDQTVFAVAAAVPPEESDLATLDPRTLTTRLAAGRKAEFHGNQVEEAPVEWSPGCCLAVPWQS